MTRYINAEQRASLPTIQTGKRGRPATDWAKVITESQSSRLVIRQSTTTTANALAWKVRLSIKENRLNKVNVFVDGPNVVITKP